MCAHQRLLFDLHNHLRIDDTVKCNHGNHGNGDGDADDDDDDDDGNGVLW